MQFRGKWIDRDSSKHCGGLRAWGEWEPESEVISNFGSQACGPHYLWKPYWVQKNTYMGLHNTDPFIFGKCFLYSVCGQASPNKVGLKHLAPGSVIAFGSGKKINGDRKWVLDTVFVVRDSIEYDPRDPGKTLIGKVSETFLSVTGGPLRADKNLFCNPAGRSLRLYWGATPNDCVDGMFSFFPAISADRKSSFPRPVIKLPDEYFNPRAWQSPKGIRCSRTLDELRHLWGSLVAQVHGAGLVLGTRAEVPPRRIGCVP